MTAVDLTGLFYTKRREKILLVAATNGPETIIGNSRQNLGNLRCVGCWWGLGGRRGCFVVAELFWGECGDRG
jgi:hypothetical protein